MKKASPILLSLAITACCYGQVSQGDLKKYYSDNSRICGGIDSLMKIKGTWERTTDDLAFPDKTFPRNQYEFVEDRVEEMLAFFKEAIPSLDGLEARWARGMRGSPYVANGPVPYSFTSSYFNYYCNTNTKKIMLGEETGTWAYVFVNQLNWFCDVVDDWDINDNGKTIRLYQLPKKVGSWKGANVYEPGAHGESCRAVIIGHDGKVPWTRITQKQYLTGLKNVLNSKKKQSLDYHDTQEKKINEYGASRLKKNPPEQHEAIRSQMQRDLESNRIGKKQSTEFFDEKIKVINDYLLSQSAETLTKPVVLEPGTGIEGFAGKFGDDEGEGIRLIAVSGRYFRKDLPRYAPQFMVLYWRWTEHPVSLNFKKQFEENFPLDRLRAMIDR